MPRYIANVDGYNLSVPRIWVEDLTSYDIRLICNGVGPDDWSARRREAIGHLLPWMVPASKPHDVRYWHIAKRLAEKRITPAQARRERLAADRELFRNWCHVIAFELGWHWWHWLSPYSSPRRMAYVSCLGIARLAYRAVRIAGKKFAQETPP